MFLTTNEQVFNTIFKGASRPNVYWRVLSGTEYNYRYKYCDENGEILPGELLKLWGVSLKTISTFALRFLDPNYKDEGAIINKIRLMACRFEKRQQCRA